MITQEKIKKDWLFTRLCDSRKRLPPCEWMCAEKCPIERTGGATFLTRLLEGERGDAWLCASCWACQTACPGDVDLHEWMMGYREEQLPPPDYVDSYRRLLETGYALKLPCDLDDIRSGSSLPPMVLISTTTLRRLLGEEDDEG